MEDHYLSARRNNTGLSYVHQINVNERYAYKFTEVDIKITR